MVNEKSNLFVRQYIKSHPDLSGNQIYLHFKGTNKGMRTQEFYKLYREVRALPEPSPVKQYKSIPLKYRKKQPIFLDQPKVSVPSQPRVPDFYVTEAYLDVKRDEKFYIKYSNPSEREQALNMLYGNYQVAPVDLVYLGRKTHKRVKGAFIAPSFRDHYLSKK